jgi:hypothetical protein
MAFGASGFGMRYETPPNASDSEGRIDADSDSVSWTEYSENMPEWDPSSAIFALMKQEYIDRLLLSFNIVQRQRQRRSHAASDQGESTAVMEIVKTATMVKMIARSLHQISPKTVKELASYLHVPT